MNMKVMKYMKYFLVALVSMVMASCAPEENYAPGEADLENCMHFYFPVNENARHHELEIDAPTFLTFKASREVTDVEASIPFVVKSDDEEIFMVEEIFFGKYEDEAEFSVYFDDAELGKKYTCTIAVEDPEYVSQYGLEATEITFSVMRVKWNYLGEGLWRDDFLSSGLVCTNPFLETECKVYERDDLKGYYKLEDVYTPEYVAMLMEGNLDYLSDWDAMIEDSPIYINMINPARPYIEASYLGLVLGNMGGAYIASDVPEILGNNSSYQYCILENGVLTAPKGGVLFELSSYGAMLANQNSMFRFVLPGYEPIDYSLALSKTESENGVLPVTFTLGSDVAVVKYAVFDGRVNEVEVISKIEAIKNGTVAVKTIEQSGTVDMEFPKSGFYTLVACTYDDQGDYQKSASLQFGYDSADDPKEVKLNAGLIVSDKHALVGRTTENSMEFYVYGEDILEARIALFKKSQYDNFQENLRKEIDYYIEPLNGRQLDSLNKTGYSGYFSGLSAGTEYSLVVYADNGYHVEYFEVSASTTGKEDVLNEEFIIYDLPIGAQPETHDAYFKEWQLWSLDPFETGAVGRKFRSDVTIFDKEDVHINADDEIVENPEDAEYTVDYVGASGFFPNISKTYQFKDEIDFEFYDGFVYSLQTMMEPGSYGGKDIYPTNMYYYVENNQLQAAAMNGLMVGGFCKDDVIAFVANPSSGMNSFAMGICYSKKQNNYNEAVIIQEDVHAYPILVDPNSSYLEDVEDVASLKAPAACNEVLELMSVSRRNYVETDRGYIMSTIDIVNSKPYNYMDRAVTCDVEAGGEAVEFSAKVSEAKKNLSNGELVPDVWTRESFLK